MGLMMSDTMVNDAILKDAVRLQNTLTDYVYEMDLAFDSDEIEVARQTETPGSWRILLRWPQRLIASL